MAEGGLNLSGGQKARVALARYTLKKGKIFLILQYISNLLRLSVIWSYLINDRDYKQDKSSALIFLVHRSDLNIRISRIFEQFQYFKNNEGERVDY